MEICLGLYIHVIVNTIRAPSILLTIHWKSILGRPGRKRSQNVERYPSGDIKPKDEISPLVAKRMMIAAAAKMADREWSTAIGRYFLTGQLTQVQYEAARKLGALAESYDRVMMGPKPPGQCIGERIKGADVDPFSEAGEKEAERHKTVAEAFEKARGVVGSRNVFEQSRRLCMGLGELPESYESFILIKVALGNLAIFWKIDGKKRL